MRCVKKLGKPDEKQGMRTCGRPVVYLTQAQALSSGRGEYSGYRHAEEVWDGDHWPVPASWVR